MHLSIFDLDHTLLTANSSFRFGLFLYRRNYFSLWKLLAGLSDYARHKWLGMTIPVLHDKSFKRLFQGHSLEEISKQAEDFLDESLNSMLYEPAVRRLRMAQEEGDRILILSSSPDFLVKVIAQRLKVDGWKATTYQTDEEGKFRSIAHVMEGEDKANYVKELVYRMDLPLSATRVYSDSYLDWPILKIAGQAIGVNPDRRLKKMCKRNGWEIL